MYGNKQFGNKQPTATADTGRRRSRLPDLHTLYLARGRGGGRAGKQAASWEGKLRAERQATKSLLSKRIVKIVLRLGKKISCCYSDNKKMSILHLFFAAWQLRE